MILVSHSKSKQSWTKGESSENCKNDDDEEEIKRRQTHNSEIIREAVQCSLQVPRPISGPACAPHRLDPTYGADPAADHATTMPPRERQGSVREGERDRPTTPTPDQVRNRPEQDWRHGGQPEEPDGSAAIVTSSVTRPTSSGQGQHKQAGLSDDSLVLPAAETAAAAAAAAATAPDPASESLAQDTEFGARRWARVSVKLVMLAGIVLAFVFLGKSAGTTGAAGSRALGGYTRPTGRAYLDRAGRRYRPSSQVSSGYRSEKGPAACPLALSLLPPSGSGGGDSFCPSLLPSLLPNPLPASLPLSFSPSLSPSLPPSLGVPPSLPPSLLSPSSPLPLFSRVCLLACVCSGGRGLGSVHGCICGRVHPHLRRLVWARASAAL